MIIKSFFREVEKLTPGPNSSKHHIMTSQSQRTIQTRSVVAAAAANLKETMDAPANAEFEDNESDEFEDDESDEQSDGSVEESEEESEGETINTESERSSDDEDEGSLVDFIVHDGALEDDSDEDSDDDSDTSDDSGDDEDSGKSDDEDTESDDAEYLPPSREKVHHGRLGRAYRIGTMSLPCKRLSKMIHCLRKKELGDETSDSSDNEYTTDSQDSRKRKRKRKEKETTNQGYTREESEYFNMMSSDDQAAMHSIEATLRVAPEELSDMEKTGIMKLPADMPLRFRLLKSAADVHTKRHLLAKLNTINSMEGHDGDYHKMHNWLQSASRLPLGNFIRLPIQRDDGIPAIRGFLEKTRGLIDTAVYGHTDSKEQILRILAQWISNPQSRGHCIGIQGPMGVGKSSLVKEGIAKALNLPFAYIALGGATDGAFLEGHSLTYEGSMPGKIAEVVMKSGCMNPVIFFDELDKVSETARGEEVANILVHLTDSAQNEHFNDRFFTELDLNMSKALMVFAYNDESKINPILLDRMTVIRVNGYNNCDKEAISRKHLIPSILEQHSITAEKIGFTDEILKTIIERVPEEKGVRNLRRGLESIISWYNMLQYLPDPEFELGDGCFEVSEAFVKKYLKKQGSASGMQEHIQHSMYI